MDVCFGLLVQFNPMSPLAEGDPGYNPSPSLEDRVHVLVCVISANLTSINPSVLEKMASVRETASSLGERHTHRGFLLPVRSNPGPIRS